jgi:CHAD domain-containing protein
MQETLERELKLEAPDGFELPDLGGSPLEPRVFTSVYHDTADRSLARAGITLRRRTERGRSVWQLKIPVDGTRHKGARVELEEPGGPVGPPEQLRMLIRAHERAGRVAPVAELRTRRHGFVVSRDGATAEITLDEVSVMDAQRVDGRFVEIEIELKEGEPAVLVRLAKELAKAGAREGAGAPKVFRVLDVGVRSEQLETPFGALRALLRTQLDEILGHDPGTRLGTDPESLHDMRVAVRRSRALLRAGTELVATDTQTLSLELKWLGGVLGDVRDLDVLLAHLRGAAAKLDRADGAAATRLLRGLERQRARARRALLKALDGQRYADLLDRFESTLVELEAAETTVTLDDLASRELKKLGRAVKAAGDEPADETLHDLRKRGKRTRYAHELAGSTKTVRRAKVLQDVLGDHQDSVVAEERLRALAHEASPDEAVAAGLLIAGERRRRAAARSEWRKAWQALKS